MRASGDVVAPRARPRAGRLAAWARGPGRPATGRPRAKPCRRPCRPWGACRDRRADASAGVRRIHGIHCVPPSAARPPGRGADDASDGWTRSHLRSSKIR